MNDTNAADQPVDPVDEERQRLRMATLQILETIARDAQLDPDHRLQAAGLLLSSTSPPMSFPSVIGIRA